jgi:hypothetical protein
MLASLYLKKLLSSNFVIIVVIIVFYRGMLFLQLFRVNIFCYEQRGFFLLPEKVYLPSNDVFLFHTKYIRDIWRTVRNACWEIPSIPLYVYILYSLCQIPAWVMRDAVRNSLQSF